MPPREDKTPRSALERALWVLRDALQRWEFTEGYAAAIMRARLGALYTPGMPFDYMASMLKAEGVRQITYTVISRGRARARAVAENNGFPLPAEPHASAATLRHTTVPEVTQGELDRAQEWLETEELIYCDRDILAGTRWAITAKGRTRAANF